jgi:hypothetical protein
MTPDYPLSTSSRDISIAFSGVQRCTTELLIGIRIREAGPVVNSGLA